MTVCASLDQRCMLTAWLVGTEHQDEHDAAAQSGTREPTPTTAWLCGATCAAVPEVGTV